MIEKNELLQIVGGINITGSLLNSIYRSINAIMDVGRSLGSAIRRFFGSNMCSI